MTKRRITPEGLVRCSRCRKAKDITEFYTAPLGQLGQLTQTGKQRRWQPYIVAEDGTEYGAPQAWCVQCIRDHHKDIPAGIDDLATNSKETAAKENDADQKK